MGRFQYDFEWRSRDKWAALLSVAFRAARGKVKVWSGLDKKLTVRLSSFHVADFLAAFESVEAILEPAPSHRVRVRTDHVDDSIAFWNLMPSFAAVTPSVLHGAKPVDPQLLLPFVDAILAVSSDPHDTRATAPYGKEAVFPWEFVATVVRFVNVTQPIAALYYSPDSRCLHLRFADGREVLVGHQEVANRAGGVLDLDDGFTERNGRTGCCTGEMFEDFQQWVDNGRATPEVMRLRDPFVSSSS